MKTFLKFVPVAVLLAALTCEAQTYVRSSSSQSLDGFVLSTASTNFNLQPFQIGFGGNGTVDLQVEATAADAGDSNLVLTVKTSIDPDELGWADETISVTNTLNGTNVVRFRTAITTGQARWIVLSSASTTQTNDVTISAKFGQHRP